MESGWCERVQMHGGREHPPPPQAASGTRTAPLFALCLPRHLLLPQGGILFPVDPYFSTEEKKALLSAGIEQTRSTCVSPELHEPLLSSIFVCACVNMCVYINIQHPLIARK